MNDNEKIKNFFNQWCEENGISEESKKDLEKINKFLNNLCEESDEFMTLLNQYAADLQKQAYIGGFKDCYKTFKEI